VGEADHPPHDGVTQRDEQQSAYRRVVDDLHDSQTLKLNLTPCDENRPTGV
jgi:hypothetical protein